MTLNKLEALRGQFRSGIELDRWLKPALVSEIKREEDVMRVDWSEMKHLAVNEALHR